MVLHFNLAYSQDSITCLFNMKLHLNSCLLHLNLMIYFYSNDTIFKHKLNRQSKSLVQMRWNQMTKEIRAKARQNQQNDLCAQQRLRSAWSVFAVHYMGAKDPNLLQTDSKVSDQTGNAGNFDGFVMLRLINMFRKHLHMKVNSHLSPVWRVVWKT